MVVAEGMALDSGAAKTGTGGGRGGVVGGAFSLSVAVVDSWLDTAAGSDCVCVCGAGGASAFAAVLVSTGGLGNSWIIYAGQPWDYWQAAGGASPHRDGRGYTAASQATRRCHCRLAMLVATAARVLEALTSRASHPQRPSARLSALWAVSVRLSWYVSKERQLHVPEVMSAGVRGLCGRWTQNRVDDDDGTHG